MPFYTPQGAIVMFLFIIGAFGCSSNENNSITQHSAPRTWTGTWSTAVQLVEPHNLPPAPGLTNNTLRQVIRPSIGGDTLRLQLSNEYSTAPTEIRFANIARSLGGDKIDTSTLVDITFNNIASLTMQPGATAISDPIAFELNPREDIAITLLFGETSDDVTGHPGSRTTSYVVEGEHTADASLPGASTKDRWYVINELDVRSDDSAAAIVVLGNSITDGRGSITNAQNRWPDILAERLMQDHETRHIAVLNQGIGGNCVLRECLGPSALDRFGRDVLMQDGVQWLIILEGVNDLGQTPDSATAMVVAEKLIAAFDSMTTLAHEAGVKVFISPILPFEKSFYYKDFREEARQHINTWIRTSGKFDGVIDMDMAVRNPDNPTVMSDSLQDNDYLHPNEMGHRVMGNSIDLALFK